MPTLYVTPCEFRSIMVALTPRKYVPIFPPDLLRHLVFDAHFDDLIEGFLLWFGVSYFHINAAKRAYFWLNEPIQLKVQPVNQITQRWAV